MNDLIDKIIKELINSELTHYKISADTGITAETISNYRRGKTKPSGANSKVLAKYFGINQDGDANSNVQQKTVIGHNISGNGNHLNSETEKFLDLLKKKDEQMDRLISVIEKLTNK